MSTYVHIYKVKLPEVPETAFQAIFVFRVSSEINMAEIVYFLSFQTNQ